MMYKIFGSYRFDQLGLTPTQERWRRSATRGPRILLDLISTHFLSRFVLFHLLHKFCLHPGPPPTWRARASWKTEIRNRSELRSTSSAQYQTEKIFLSSQQQSQASGLVAGQNKTVLWCLRFKKKYGQKFKLLTYMSDRGNKVSNLKF